MKRAASQHEQAILARTIRAFVELRGEADAERRAAEIDALPARPWRGVVLRAILCRGEFGRGPHVMNVPRSLLWNLIDLRAFRCPYHA